MLDSLERVHQKVRNNKKEEKSFCAGYPLADNYDGPVFIEHAGKSAPKVIIVSESPAGFESIEYDFSKIDRWKEKVMDEIRNFTRWETIGQLNTLAKFLAALTANNMSDPENPITVNPIYWTHAVKCFIQRDEPLHKAKRRLGKRFDKACRFCAGYL